MRAHTSTHADGVSCFHVVAMLMFLRPYLQFQCLCWAGSDMSDPCRDSYFKLLRSCMFVLHSPAGVRSRRQPGRLRALRGGWIKQRVPVTATTGPGGLCLSETAQLPTGIIVLMGLRFPCSLIRLYPGSQGYTWGSFSRPMFEIARALNFKDTHGKHFQGHAWIAL